MRNARRLAWGVGLAILAAGAITLRLSSDRGGPEAGAPTASVSLPTAPPGLAGLGRSVAETSNRTDAVEPPAPVVESPEGVRASMPGNVRVVLRLLRSDGRPTERATIRSGDEIRFRPWDPRTGTVELGPGRQSVEILGGRFGEWRQPEDFAIDARPGMTAVDVPLRPWRMIIGRITAAGDRPAIPAAARLRTVDATGQRIRPRGEEREVALGEPSDGWFCFGQDFELERGTYEVSAAPWAMGPDRASREVSVGEEAAFVELVLPGSERSEGVLLTVLDPDGRPHEPSEVTLDVRDAMGGGGGGGATVEPLGDGTMWVPTLLPGYSGQDPVEVTLWVRSKTYGERRIDVPVKRGAAPIVVRYAEPAALHLTLGHRYEWLRHAGDVEVWTPVGLGARRLATAVIYSDGVATFRALQPGDVHVGLVGKGPAEGLVLGLTRPTLRSGENRVIVTAPPLHRLRVHGAQGMLSIRATDGSGTRGTVGKWPNDFSPSLPPGTYELRSGSRTATVVIPGTSEVTLAEPQRK